MTECRYHPEHQADCLVMIDHREGITLPSPAHFDVPVMRSSFACWRAANNIMAEIEGMPVRLVICDLAAMGTGATWWLISDDDAIGDRRPALGGVV